MHLWEKENRNLEEIRLTTKTEKTRRKKGTIFSLYLSAADLFLATFCSSFELFNYFFLIKMTVCLLSKC